MKSFLGVAYSLRAPYAAPQLLTTRKEKERGRAVTHRQHKSNATTARFRACGAHEKKAKGDSLEAVVGLVEVAVDARQPKCEEEHHAGVGLCLVRVVVVARRAAAHPDVLARTRKMRQMRAKNNDPKNNGGYPWDEAMRTFTATFTWVC